MTPNLEAAALCDAAADRLTPDILDRLQTCVGTAYETRPDTRTFDPTSPNGKLMILSLITPEEA